MYLKCSSYFPNCHSCIYHKCNNCKEGFAFLNNDFKRCYNVSELNSQHYFTEDNITYNSCDDYRFKNNIKCFSILPRQNIVLTFIQAQLKYYKLIIFMLTHSPLPKGFSIKITIKVFNSGSRRFRNLNTYKIH